MLTLIFSNEKSVKQAVIECYKELYFQPGISFQEQQKHLFTLMRDATLTDITCIEELIGELIKEKTFD